MSEPLVLPAMTEVDVDRAECPDCGGDFKVNADGSIRSHKCNGVRTINATATGDKPKTTRAKRGSKGKAPSKVKTVGSAVIAAGVEAAARQVIARAVPCPPSAIPEEVVGVPDAMQMVGPLIDALWPQIPAGGQKLIANLADQEELILCVLEWVSWFKTLREWAEGAARIVAEAERQKTAATAATAPTVPTRPYGVPNEPTQSASQDIDPVFGQPFQPVADDAFGAAL